MAINPDFLTALVSVNASALIAVAVEWRSSLDDASSDPRHRQNRKAARLSLGLAGLSSLGALIALAAANWPQWAAWPLLVLTVAAVLSLYLVFFRQDHEEADRWLCRHDALVTGLIGTVIGVGAWVLLVAVVLGMS